MGIFFFVEHAFDDGKVQLTMLQHGQQVLCVVHDQLQPVMLIPQELPHRGDDHEFADGLGGAHPQEQRVRADKAYAQVMLRCPGAVDVALQLLRFRRAQQLAAIVHKELHPIETLQIVNVLRHAGLRHAQTFSSAAVVHLLVQGQEGFDAIVQHVDLHKIKLACDNK